MSVDGRTVSLAGRNLCIEATSERAYAAIAPAIAHLPTASSADDRQTKWTIVEEDDSWRPQLFAGTGVYRIQGGGLALAQIDPASLEFYHPETGIELRAGPAALAAGDLRAQPASQALAAWLAGYSTQVLHAGAIAYEGAAALIVGKGGTGKSTTVLTCAMAGADFLGDDLVLVECGADNLSSEPTVHCLFASAKLNADSACALGAETWPSLGVTPKNKSVVAVQHRLRVVRSARIVAIIVLAPPVDGLPRPEPIPMAKVLTSIAPTALPLASGASTPAAWLATAAELARRIPAYRLPVSWALDTFELVVREIIEKHRAACDCTDRGDTNEMRSCDHSHW